MISASAEAKATALAALPEETPHLLSQFVMLVTPLLLLLFPDANASPASMALRTATAPEFRAMLRLTTTISS